MFKIGGRYFQFRVSSKCRSSGQSSIVLAGEAPRAWHGRDGERGRRHRGNRATTGLVASLLTLPVVVPRSFESSPRLSWEIPGSRCLSAQRAIKSYTINTSRVETSPGHHHGGRVAVPGFGRTTGLTGIGTFGQRETVLGSRTTVPTVHGRIGGVDQSEVPAVLGRHLHELPAHHLVGRKLPFAANALARQVSGVSPSSTSPSVSDVRHAAASRVGTDSGAVPRSGGDRGGT
jgi:hypothetical protein